MSWNSCACRRAVGTLLGSAVRSPRARCGTGWDAGGSAGLCVLLHLQRDQLSWFDTAAERGIGAVTPASSFPDGYFSTFFLDPLSKRLPLPPINDPSLSLGDHFWGELTPSPPLLQVQPISQPSPVDPRSFPPPLQERFHPGDSLNQLSRLIARLSPCKLSHGGVMLPHGDAMLQPGPGHRVPYLVPCTSTRGPGSFAQEFQLHPLVLTPSLENLSEPH